MIGGVDDGWMVWAGEHIGDSRRLEQSQDDRFCPQDNPLSILKLTWRVKRETGTLRTLSHGKSVSHTNLDCSLRHSSRDSHLQVHKVDSKHHPVWPSGQSGGWYLKKYRQKQYTVWISCGKLFAPYSNNNDTRWKFRGCVGIEETGKSFCLLGK